ncbi:hypothetical protein K493DRAFT_310561 [Basidiobolus meristosporus CBS 931.73]|uniref:CMP/dCMP-type deaminase domain-containing protein n=1 Tax=Basidiobolus meristosporus CBS 931.73 TaxID=1314790 RepID=A0A1Y1Z887_9FUNG|nr:hypothetical protein K493DRAFT_310561 [Basidiobolus meristosporus CBS 931.73]|eukprot:ORY06426.1 hypothetical protein K493DRAFT_310561 [Basidiobolus meristosporus CBS 931.73]
MATSNPESLEDAIFLKKAIEQANLSIPVDTAYCVGAVLVKNGVVLSEGYSRELPGNTHAEECCLLKLSDLGEAHGAVMYTTMEPCSLRLSGNKPCCERLIEAKIKRVVLGVLEPPKFVEDCTGAMQLEKNGIEVYHLKGFEEECLRPNSHVLKK